jgi:hypothetical protein
MRNCGVIMMSAGQVRTEREEASSFMDKSIHFETVEIRPFMMGRDVVFLVTGGTAHIGASATAYVTNDQDVQVEVLALPGHREGPLAAELAETACRTLGRTVAVLAGIHLDQPSRQDIETVVAEAKRKMSQMLDQWNNGQK